MVGLRKLRILIDHWVDHLPRSQTAMSKKDNYLETTKCGKKTHNAPNMKLLTISHKIINILISCQIKNIKCITINFTIKIIY